MKKAYIAPECIQSILKTKVVLASVSMAVDPNEYNGGGNVRMELDWEDDY